MTDEKSTPVAADPAMTEFVNPDQLKKDIAIDITNLTGDMQEHASRYVEYAMKAVRARRQYERYKLVLEVKEAQLDSRYRTVLKEENPKTTEGQIRAAVVTDAEYRAASARVIDSQQQFRLAEISERAFDQRKDMLLQIARDAAREGAGQLRVVANATNKERLAEVMERSAAVA
jgi:hypothetical protein